MLQFLFNFGWHSIYTWAFVLSIVVTLVAAGITFFKTKSWKTSVVLGIVVGAFLITPVYHSHHEHVDNVRMEKEFNDVN
jgi:uncharacterized transporter YbjL